MEFSRDYIGRAVRVIGSNHDWYRANGHSWPNISPETKILGVYGGEYVIYKPKEYGGYDGYISHEGIEVAVECSWRMKALHLELIEETFISTTKPYPNKCPICQSPARRNKSVLICSNLKCKSRKTYHKSLPKLKKPVKPRIRDEKNRLLCDKCGDFIHNASGRNGTTINGYCGNGCLGATKIELLNGDIIFAPNSNYSYVYSASSDTWSKVQTIRD